MCFTVVFFLISNACQLRLGLSIYSQLRFFLYIYLPRINVHYSFGLRIKLLNVQIYYFVELSHWWKPQFWFIRLKSQLSFGLFSFHRNLVIPFSTLPHLHHVTSSNNTWILQKLKSFQLRIFNNCSILTSCRCVKLKLYKACVFIHWNNVANWSYSTIEIFDLWFNDYGNGNAF